MPDPTYTSTTSTRTRRTRFVCISDTHNRTVKLPPGDVLIHAGDLTNQGSHSELSKAVQWLEKAKFEAKIIVAGNHDITLDRDFYTEHGAYFHNQAPQDPSQCLSLLTSSPSVTYLAHSSATVRLSSAAGPRTTFTVFGSPYSPRDGLWAFAYDRSTPTPSSAPAPAAALASATASPARPALPAAANLWSAIPLATDILVTHAPPRAHGDECATRGRALGCEDLRRALWRVRPRLHVCGHVHEGRGAARVRWALAGRNVAWAEEGTTVWEDPGRAGAKMSLVDLTGRGGGGSPLENDGAVGEPGAGGGTGPTPHLHCDCGEGRRGRGVPGPAEECVVCHPELAQPSGLPVDGGRQHPGAESLEARPGSGTLGMGGDPARTKRCDVEALAGRMGRRETCVVNCAIMANNYPHVGGKRFNKPIVVDLDLPVWGDEDWTG